MKNLFILITATMFASCATTSLRQIGSVNMISNRNVDSKTEYVLLQAYAGGSESDLKESESLTIDDAINEPVKSVAGGEFLKNVKIYTIMRGSVFYYAAVGDVWGIAGVENSYNGLRSGDKVTWKNPKKITDEPKYLTGVVLSVKLDDETAIVQKDDNDLQYAGTVEVDLDELSKIK